MSQVMSKLIAAYADVNENQKAAIAKTLAKSASSSEKGKAAVTLPTAPWDKKKDSTNEVSGAAAVKLGSGNAILRNPKTGKLDPNGKMPGVKQREAMDPVDKKELKGKHADRDDKDIDNDGDADASDEYLHNRRKAVSKATGKESLAARIKGKMSAAKDDEVVMNPKKEKTEKKSSAGMAQESVVYARILEARKMKATADKDGKHAKGATDQEEMGDKQASSKGAQDMMNTPIQVTDNPEASGDEVKKAADAGPKAATRQGDNKAGDKKIISSATPTKGM